MQAFNMGKAAVSGFFKVETYKADENGKEIQGSRRVAADWFPNLITDGGLNRMGASSDFLVWCQVGTGTTAPATTDTQLENRIASSNSFSQTSGRQSTDPYYAWNRRSYTFSAGVATGNLTEFGIGWASSGSLFSRALFLDNNGDPTTIVVLSDEILDVIYELRFYFKTTDITGTVTFSGGIGGTHDWTMRSAFVTAFGVVSVNSGFISSIPAYNNNNNVSNSAITSITSGPASTLIAAGTFAALSYVNQSLKREFLVTFGVNNGNVSGGIRSFTCSMGFGAYQIEFDPPIPKTSSDTLNFVLFHEWGRKT